MKKFLLLLSLVLYPIMGAMAQTQEEFMSWVDTQEHNNVVTNLSELSNYKAYSIIPEDWYHICQDGDVLKPNGLFGVLFARESEAAAEAIGSKGDRLLSAGGWGNTVDNQDPRKDIYGGWQTVERAVRKDSSDPRQQFAVISYEGNYYLWCVAARKFAVIKDLSHLGQTTFYAELSNEKAAPLRLEPVTDSGFLGPYAYDGDKNPDGECDITGPRFRFFFTNEKDNQEYRMHFSWAWHNNSNYQTECLMQTGAKSTDGLDIFEICERADFDPTEPLTILDDYFHPKSTIVYHVTDGMGGEIFTSDVIPIRTGTVVSDMPDRMKEDFYQYSCTPLTIQLGPNVLELVRGERVYPMNYLAYTAPAERTTGTGASSTNPALTYSLSGAEYYYFTIGNKFVYVEPSGTGYTLKYSDALDTSNSYQWCFMEATDKGEGCFRIFNKVAGGQFSFNLQGTTAAVLALRKSTDRAFLFTPQGTPYGVGFAISKSDDNDSYFQISEEVAGAIQLTDGEGERPNRLYPYDKHRALVYSAEQELPEVDVTFRVAAGATTYAEGVYPVTLGTLVSAMDGYADDLMRDFTDYEYSDAFVALPGELNILTATPTFTLPFKEGKTYPIRVDGMYIKADAANGAVVIDDTADDESIKGDNTYYWAFRGNPYGGIEIRNVGTGLYIANDPNITDNVPLPLTATAEWWTPWNVVDYNMSLQAQTSDTYVINNGGVLELSLDETEMWEEYSSFEVVPLAPTLQSVTVGGVSVTLEDGVYEYQLPFAYNPGIAVEATAAEDCTVYMDNIYGYDEPAYYDDSDPDNPFIMVSVENERGDGEDYIFTFTPAKDVTAIGGEYDGALSVVLGLGGTVNAMPFANTGIELTENQDGTMNLSRRKQIN